MGRPEGKGIKYFSLDVIFDTQLEVIVDKLDIKSLGVIVRIWQHIYKNYGYFTPYDEDELHMIRKQCGTTSIEELEKIIKLMLEKNLFSKDMFEKHNILTSKRLQENFYQATRNRTKDGIYKDYMLVSYARNKQRKEKKIKLNEIKSNNSILNESKVMAATELISQEFKRLLTPAETKDIINLFNDLNPTQEEIENATLISIQRRVNNIAYIRGIIEKDRDGFKVVNPPSLEEALGGKL